jgi:peptidoglycan hydrolase-like protein with peptidoglycan-binding domain
MKKSILLISIILLTGIFANAQTNTTPSPTPTATPTTTKKPTFRATKDQIMQVQKMLKEKGTYTGEADGKMNDPFRASIKTYQKDNGLRQSGTLNRATLEKMGIALTDKQKEIPVNPDDLKPTETSSTSTTKKVIFRATKEQIMAAQKILKDGGMYAGEQTGKLDDDTRAGLKKYQTANGLPVTGTLNQVTLEKMGVPLTDKQKADAAKTSQ